MARGERVYSYTDAKRNRNASRNVRRNSDYLYGNVVPKQDIQRKRKTQPKHKPASQAGKDQARAHRLSLGYVVFIAAALLCAGFVLINYIQLQSDITNMAEIVMSKEQELNKTRLLNDETLNRIESSIDLEEIKRIAIGELGMVYAKEGQIETYTSEGHDYLRKVVQD